MRFLRQALIGLVLMSMALGLLGYAGYLDMRLTKRSNRVKREYPKPANVYLPSTCAPQSRKPSHRI